MHIARLILVLVSLSWTSMVARAEPLVLDGGWQTFEIPLGEAPIPWGSTFEVSLSAPALLIVQDAYLNLEGFEVFDNGVSLGETSFPDERGGHEESDPDVAGSLSTFSRGEFLLAPGDHVISGTDLFSILSDESPAVSFIRLDSLAIPAPGTLALLFAPLLAYVHRCLQRRAHRRIGPDVHDELARLDHRLQPRVQ